MGCGAQWVYGASHSVESITQSAPVWPLCWEVTASSLRATLRFHTSENPAAEPRSGSQQASSLPSINEGGAGEVGIEGGVSIVSKSSLDSPQPRPLAPPALKNTDSLGQNKASSSLVPFL